MVEGLRVGIVGCGDLGTELGKMLLSQGHEVIGVRRSGDKLPDGFVKISADISSEDGFQALPKDLDTWVYALAADDRSDAAYERAYVTGVERLQEHLGGMTSKVLFVSSTSVYEFEDGREVTEATEIQPSGMSGATIRRGEQIVEELGGSSLRLGGIYGAGRHWLVRAVQEGKASLKPGEPRYTNRIHRDDAVGLLHAMTVSQATLPKIVLGVDQVSSPWNDVVSFIAAKLGTTLPEEGVGRAPSGSRRATNKRCRSLHRDDLDYELKYPTFREGYLQVLKEMGLVSG